MAAAIAVDGGCHGLSPAFPCHKSRARPCYDSAVQSLRHAELKTARALEHLEALKVELKRFYDSSPYTITRSDNVESGKHVVRVQMKDVSDRTAILAGDFVHNLRSALDHAVFSLAVYATKAVPKKRLQWPVLETPNDKALKQQTGGVPAEAVAIMESLQPYHEGAGEAFKRSPLWQLHKLDIIDKHRRVAIGLHGFTCHFPSAVNPGSWAIEKRELEGGYEVSLPPVAATLEMIPDLSPGVLFGDEAEGVTLNFEQLGALYKFVCDGVLPRFARFFTGAEAATVRVGV